MLVLSIVRCFYQGEYGIEHTLWMKPEQTFITEYESYVDGSPSRFSLQFYEDSEVCCIKRNVLMELYARSSSWVLFGINLTETIQVTLMDVFVNLLSNDATRNYQYIEYAFPRLTQVTPLKDIALTLQISPVSLSRIRGHKQTKV